MTAPSLTARGTPSGIAMPDGYQTLVAFAINPTVSFWEKTVQPAGRDGGDAIDTTTMHNINYRVMRARSLKTITPFTIKAAWDPAFLAEVDEMINVEGSITTHFADGSTDTMYGFLQKAEPQEVSEGAQPEINLTIQPTNWDPVANVEVGPVVVSVSGT